MKLILLITLFAICTCLRYDDGNSGNSVIEEQIKEIQQHKIGQAILKMAELNYKLQGPVDELIQTIKSFGRQLIERVEQENLDYEAIKAESVVKVQQLKQIISDAENEQNKQRKRIGQELEPRKNDIEKQLLRLKDSKQQNESRLKMQEALRKQQYENFEKSKRDIGDLIKITDDTLKMVGSLLPRPDCSFIEMDKIQLNKEESKDLTRRLRNIKGRVDGLKGYENVMETLVQLTDSNFKQRHFIKSVLDLLNKLRKSLVESQNKLINDEKEQERAFSQWDSAQDGETNVFDREWNDLMEERDDIQSFVADCENIIKIHQADIDLYGERVKLEEQSLLISKQTHEELVKQINNELDIIQKSIKLLYSPAIFEYLKYKINLGP
ncbi:unnamed protein product [Paramecium pentaurelia]|uniref:Uncharacterized protein n=1 Tax=Paramecium pentaurelia TaxID=43138 RepID=A0A8S1SJM1_9CILI|nr:unnamed protein product [Paramecium pentaurelia]